MESVCLDKLFSPNDLHVLLNELILWSPAYLYSFSFYPPLSMLITSSTNSLRLIRIRYISMCFILYIPYVSIHVYCLYLEQTGEKMSIPS